MRPPLQIVQGTLDMLVLRALRPGPAHGYGVTDWIRRVTDGVLEIEDGALYTALHRMEKRGWVQSEWGLSENKRRAKFYSLTSDGASELERSERTWNLYIDAVAKVLGHEGGTA